MRQVTIVDTQLLVLLTVGATSSAMIRKHGNLSAFTVDDFTLLTRLISGVDLLLLPNIVTETDNLLRQHRDPERSRIVATFAQIITGANETYRPSRDLVQRSGYVRLGLTDTAVIDVAEAGAHILTADAQLYLSAFRRGLSATNFNHEREKAGIL